MTAHRFLSEPWVAELDRLLTHQRFSGATKGYVVGIECTNDAGLPTDHVHLVFDEERVRAVYGEPRRADASIIVDRALAEALWTEQDPTFGAMVYNAGMIRSRGDLGALLHLQQLLVAGTKQALVAAMEPFTAQRSPTT
ncbi:hypothetical protein BH20ACT2_BH20ACT2_09530 [soil metagenome]